MIRTAIAPVRVDFAGGTTDIPPFPQEYGGAVLNAAINKYVEGRIEKTTKGLSLRYDCKVPTHFGLGTSGAMSLVWLAIVLNNKNKKELAEGVFKIDRVLGLTSGRQDQYASAFGGINFLEFLNNKVKLTKVNLSNSEVKKFESRLLLCYNEKMKRHQDLNKLVLNRLNKNDKVVVNSLKNLRDVAIQMKAALVRKKYRKVADLMNQEWKNRRQILPGMITKQVDSLIKKGMEAGALGAKPCGSCNGGVILFYTEDKEKMKRKIAALKYVNYIDFKFDFKGLQLKNIKS